MFSKYHTTVLHGMNYAIADRLANGSKRTIVNGLLTITPNIDVLQLSSKIKYPCKSIT